MDDLQAALQQLLADPQQLSELAAMASALGLHPPEGGSVPPGPPTGPELQKRPETQAAEPERQAASVSPRAAPIPQQPPDAKKPPGPPPGDRREKLLLALRPFLKPERQQKLDRALRIARLTQLAGTALSGRDHR